MNKLELRERSLSTAERLERVERLLEESQRAVRRQLSLEDEKALQDAILSIVEERRGELVREVRRQGQSDPERANRRPERGHGGAGDHRCVTCRTIGGGEELEDRLTAQLSREAQAYLDSLEGWQRPWQLWRWVYEALATEDSAAELWSSSSPRS